MLDSIVFFVFYRLATFTNDGWISGLAMAPAAGWLFVANVSYGYVAELVDRFGVSVGDIYEVCAGK